MSMRRSKVFRCSADSTRRPAHMRCSTKACRSWGRKGRGDGRAGARAEAAAAGEGAAGAPRRGAALQAGQFHRPGAAAGFARPPVTPTVATKRLPSLVGRAPLARSGPTRPCNIVNKKISVCVTRSHLVPVSQPCARTLDAYCGPARARGPGAAAPTDQVLISGACARCGLTNDGAGSLTRTEAAVCSWGEGLGRGAERPAGGSSQVGGRRAAVPGGGRGCCRRCPPRHPRPERESGLPQPQPPPSPTHCLRTRQDKGAPAAFSVWRRRSRASRRNAQRSRKRDAVYELHSV